MTTKVIFNMDKKLKESALRKARKLGTTLTTVLNLATKAYVEDRLQVDIFGETLAKAREEVRQGKTYSEAEVYKRLGIKMK
jgi:ribosomal protein S4